MKKLFFVFAATALCAACSQDTESLATQSTDKAIGFDVYTASPVTRGTVETLDKFKTKGIGVFAFYQPANNGVPGADYTTIKYPTPNFMYNQKIAYSYDGAITKWDYTPVKYWPNNKNDKLSFFAYAPYDSKTTWEDLGIKTDATGKTITKTFEIYNDVKDQKDYLFAEPVVNKEKPKNITPSDNIGQAQITGDATSEYTTDNDHIKFNFKHVLSKINLYVGAEVDATTGTPGAWGDPNTTIEIKSIEFKELYQTYTYTSNATPKWSGDGEQNIIVKPYTSTTPAANYGLIDKTWTAGWHRYLQGTQVDDTGTSENETQTTTDNDQYMFLAPQTLGDKEVVITYVVKTNHIAAEGQTKDNDSEITNVVTKTWSDFSAALTSFETGKQYNLYFLIGVQSVKVAATITDWANGSDNNINVPAADGI